MGNFRYGTVMPEEVNAEATPSVPTLSELFIAFSTISLSGFGGVLPWARRKIVEDLRWMSAQEFNEAFSLCQFLPGPNIVNFAVIFGSRFRGPAGALVTLAGLLGPPIAIVIALGALYAEFGEREALRRMLAGVATAAAGLLIAVAVRMAEPLVRGRLGPAPGVALVVLAAVGIMRLPLLPVLLTLVPASIVLALWLRR